MVKVIVTLLNSRSLWFSVHVILDTDDSVYLGFDGEITSLGELTRFGIVTAWLLLSATIKPPFVVLTLAALVALVGASPVIF